MNIFYETLKSCYYFFKAFFSQPFYFFKKSRVSLSSRIGRLTVIYGSVIGNYCYIGQGCILNNVRMGNYCSVAPGVQIGGMEHSWWWGSTSTRLSDKHIVNLKTVIEDDVWIGANAVIRQGVHIERGAVIGACSLVIKDVLPYSVAAGIPSRLLRKRFPDSIISQIEKTEFWLCPPKIAKKLLSEIDYPELLSSKTYILKKQEQETSSADN